VKIVLPYQFLAKYFALAIAATRPAAWHLVGVQLVARVIGVVHAHMVAHCAGLAVPWHDGLAVV
jgi:hypothetical protein